MDLGCARVVSIVGRADSGKAVPIHLRSLITTLERVAKTPARKRNRRMEPIKRRSRKKTIRRKKAIRNPTKRKRGTVANTS